MPGKSAGGHRDARPPRNSELVLFDVMTICRSYGVENKGGPYAKEN